MQLTGIAGSQWASSGAAGEERTEEDALYAVGEQFNNLNACALASPSCVSTQNDDEKHFIPPWQYDGPQAAAIDNLVSLATGARPLAPLPLSLSILRYVLSQMQHCNSGTPGHAERGARDGITAAGDDAPCYVRGHAAVPACIGRRA